MENAIRSLTDEQVERLYVLAYTLQAKLITLEPKELLTAAIQRTLDGDRTWYSARVDFVGHLMGVMKSMASHDPRGREARVLDASTMDLVSQTADPESILKAAEDVAELEAHIAVVERHFVDDPDVGLLIEEIKEGRDGRAARASMGVTATEYVTILRRFRRGLIALRRRGELP